MFQNGQTYFENLAAFGLKKWLNQNISRKILFFRTNPRKSVYITSFLQIWHINRVLFALIILI